MIAVFYIVWTLGFVFFIVRRRTFDIPALAYLGCSVWFIPAFFGIVRYRYSPGVIMEDPIHPIVYSIYCFVIISLILSGYLCERITFRTQNDNRSLTHTYLWYVLVILSVCIIIIFIALESDEALSPGKPSYGRTHKFLHTFIGMLLVASVIYNKLKLTAFLGAILIFDVYAGNREAFAMGLAGILYVSFSRHGEARLIRKYMYMLLSILLLLALFIYKRLYGLILLADYKAVSERIWDIDWIVIAIQRSQPFLTQSALNSVVVNDYQYEGPYFINISNNLIPFTTDVLSNDGLQEWINREVYPMREHGIASNIFAEAYVVGWLPLVTVYILIFFLIMPTIYQWLISRSRGIIASMYIVSATYSMIYIHRSGLIYQATIQSRLIISFLCLYVLALISKNALEYKPKKVYD